MHAPRLLVYTSSPLIISAQTMLVAHQFPCTSAKTTGTTKNADQSNSPTSASLKSLGAMICRQRKSRQKSSPTTGTPSTAPATRTATKLHAAVVEGNTPAAKGLKTSSDGLKKVKWF